MIQKMEFGKTGHISTRALFGAAAFYNVTQLEADRTMEVVEEYGINHIDTAASYGESEVRLGPWLKHNRKKVFLATKTGLRTYQEARDELHRSLERLCVDSVDMWQMHFLVDEEGWNTAMSEDGALRAFQEARDEGLVRFLGVTGHGLETPAMHLKSLERFDFDSVLLPYNYLLMQDSAYKEKFEKLLALCCEKKIAFQAIKTLTRGPWKTEGDHEFDTWYEPLSTQEEIDLAVHWTLSRQALFLNTPADITLLPKVLKAADSFDAPVSDEIMKKGAEKMGLSPLFE